MNKGKVVLTNYTFDKENKVEAKFSVEQNNGSTSVEQELTLTGDVGFMHESWVATIALDDFPIQKTPEAAALKMADWLDRLSQAIRSGDFELPSHTREFKDL